MSLSDRPLVSIELLSSVARADGALYAGMIIAVRADVAAAWIADGLAKPATALSDVETAAAASAPEAAMRPPARSRGSR
jgi:hypothetical protein